MAEFKDHFSGHSTDYAKYRPSYPPALFEWLAALAPARERAWDVGTGSGQAALGLAPHFRQVIATDPAEAQLRNAGRHERILYRMSSAEQTDIADASVDLVTVAQALHWFDFERFYREVRRVAKPGAVIAAWTYGLTEISPAVDTIARRYYLDIVGPYWPDERKYVEQSYRNIAFPFAEIAAPAFAMRTTWTADEFLGYLGTWSATKRYATARGENPLAQVDAALKRAWGEAQARTVAWPLYLRVGTIAPP